MNNKDDSTQSNTISLVQGASVKRKAKNNLTSRKKTKHDQTSKCSFNSNPEVLPEESYEILPSNPKPFQSLQQFSVYDMLCVSHTNDSKSLQNSQFTAGISSIDLNSSNPQPSVCKNFTIVNSDYEFISDSSENDDSTHNPLNVCDLFGFRNIEFIRNKPEEFLWCEGEREYIFLSKFFLCTNVFLEESIDISILRDVRNVFEIEGKINLTSQTETWNLNETVVEDDIFENPAEIYEIDEDYYDWDNYLDSWEGNSKTESMWVCPPPETIVGSSCTSPHSSFDELDSNNTLTFFDVVPPHTNPVSYTPDVFEADTISPKSEKFLKNTKIEIFEEDDIPPFVKHYISFYSGSLLMIETDVEEMSAGTSNSSEELIDVEKSPFLYNFDNTEIVISE